MCKAEELGVCVCVNACRRITRLEVSMVKLVLNVVYKLLEGQQVHGPRMRSFNPTPGQGGS